MDDRGLEIYEPFKSETMTKISNISRCKIIDEMIQDEIDKNSNTVVYTIGAGFDTRPYRLRGGCWYELDEPQIIEYKNTKLPEHECRNSLKRVSIRFSDENLKDKLQAVETNAHIIVVIEGVFMYLEPEDIHNTVKELQMMLPAHILLCDLMNRAFFEKYAQPVHKKLVAAGGTFTARPVNPAGQFLEHGYREICRVPMVRRALELGMYRDYLKLPGFLATILFIYIMKDMSGYAIHRFQYG